MNNLTYFREQFHRLQNAHGSGSLGAIRRQAFEEFNKTGIPTTRNEEWKYTRISNLFNKEYEVPSDLAELLPAEAWASHRLPGHEDANELVFVNGIFSAPLSTIRSGNQLLLLPLEEACESRYRDIVAKHFGHSNHYLKDGMNALNTAFLHGGIFIYIREGQILEYPVYLYNISDTRTAPVLSQPRSLVYVGEGAHVQFAETFVSIGLQESFTNHILEIAVEKDAMLEYYKIQDDVTHANQVSTTHIRQTGKSYTHAVTISLGGGIIRNNLHAVMEAAHSESHLYGLYFSSGNTHIDNHTIVDNVQPYCESNELYKGVIDDEATGVFNGKIFVRPQAQKTNAYQSNKNILLSEKASVNSKPQLEIFADDVKCSHGCTVGQLDGEGLFYLQSRGIPEKKARALLLHGFTIEIVEKIKLAPIRNYVDKLISERLEFNMS